MMSNASEVTPRTPTLLPKRPKKHRIKGTFAAPRHQAQNGTCERTWQSMREIAFKMMVHAHAPDEFYDFALEQAWKMFSCLPIRDLELDGKPCTPMEAFTSTKPSLCCLRVMFCPCAINIGDSHHKKSPVKRRNNCCERGMRGIHVGLPRHLASNRRLKDLRRRVIRQELPLHDSPRSSLHQHAIPRIAK
jgi:hypothetical protein